MIYSKTGKIWSNDYEFNKVGTLDKVNLSKDNVVYYHHPYDNLFHKVSFVEAVDPENFEHIRRNPTVTLVHENTSEAIDARFAEEVYQVISKHNLNPGQVKVVTADENHKNFLKSYLENKKIFGTKITVHNVLLSKVDEVSIENNNTVKKFSSLSRNYKDWRLFLYEELFRHNLLKDFTYSFHNIWPYTNVPQVFTVEQMVEDLNKLGVNNLSKEFLTWLRNCPYDIPEDIISRRFVKWLNKITGSGVKDKWSTVTYDAICSADFHLMVETHFDQRSFTGQINFDRSFGPSSITEKAYKAIACSRPFIVFATPYFLEDLRNLGYKTFSPFINESYDRETDNHKRLNMIVAEVKRICDLPQEEYTELVARCRTIAKYNSEHFKKHKDQHKNDA